MAPRFIRPLRLMATALALGGCVRFQPRPLSPGGTLDAFEARTLDRADLGDYLRNHGQAPTWPRARWDLPALTLAAFFYHPDLDVARAQWAVARGEGQSAGERPEPSLSVAPGYNISTPSGPVSAWLATVGLAFPLETAGKRAHRVAQARELSESARLNVVQTAWQVRRGVRTALLDLYAAERTEVQALRKVDVQAEAADLFARQAEAGELSPAEAGQVRIQLESTRLAALAAEQGRAEARAALASALGIPLQALAGIAFSFDELERLPAAPPSDAARRQALLGRADILGALAEYEASQAALQLEIARQYPDLEIGPGYEFDQGDNKWSLGLTLTLPVFNRNRGAIRAAGARRSEAAAKFAALQARVIGELDQAEAGCRTARARIEAAGRLQDRLGKREQTARAMLAAGEISRVEVATRRLESAESEQAGLDAKIEGLRALGRLEDVLQSPFDLADWPGRVPPSGTAEGPGKESHE